MFRGRRPSALLYARIVVAVIAVGVPVWVFVPSLGAVLVPVDVEEIGTAQQRLVAKYFLGGTLGDNPPGTEDIRAVGDIGDAAQIMCGGHDRLRAVAPADEEVQ